MGKEVDQFDFDKWADEQSRKILRTEHFESMGKGKDYIFQSLVFMGEASQGLSLASTVLRELEEVPEDLKANLHSIQNQLHDLKEHIRKVTR